jgi:ATPase family protein associated with various cellular activities (AAA)
MRITISAKRIQKLLETYPKEREPVEKSFVSGMGFQGTTVTLESVNCPKEFLEFILENDGQLSDKQRTSLIMATAGVVADSDTPLSKPKDVQDMISCLRVNGDYNAEYKLGERWYPVNLKASYHPPAKGEEAYCAIEGKLRLVDMTHSEYFYITNNDFTDDQGQAKQISGKQLFLELGLRHLQQELTAYQKKLARAALKAAEAGYLVAATGSGFVRSDSTWSRQLISFKLGSIKVPKKVVIEDELETAGYRARYEYEKGFVALPFVRVFSLELKRFLYVDVDDITEYKFDKTCLDSLVLPEREKSTITKLFNADTEDLFGDVLQDKHGGMIILANGKAGVGKTLTAEIFAEMTERPLYVMEMSELGVKAEGMEQALSRIFQRVTKWNAILLMDEADIFLAKRGESLERSVIVGIFLRLMDYYKGLLFLTSNRKQDIDDAFKSRITIAIDYPDLDREARLKIWKIMLEKSKIVVIGGIDGIPDNDLNGRQIRNMVRLVKVLHGDEVTAEQINNACGFVCK